MPLWELQTDAETAAIGRLDSESDRAAAIIAATILEDRLKSKIKSLLRTDELRDGQETLTAKLLRDVFKADAPFGQFGTKIKMGFLMKIYGEGAYKELNCVKDIRNLFAHELSVQDFDTQQIRDKIKNLTFIEHYITDSRPRNAIVKRLTGNTIVLAGVSIDDAHVWFNKPKDRYIATCAMYASWLTGNKWGRCVHSAIAGDGDTPPYPDIPF